MRFRDAVSNEGTVAAVIPEILEPAGTWYEAIRRGAEANLRSYPADVAFLTSVAIRASSYNDPGLIEAGLQRHTEALASYSELYDTVLRWSRRRLRPGFTLHDLAAAMAAISEGFGLQNAAGVPHERLLLDATADGPGDREWSLLAVCAVAVCERLTEPDPASPPFDPATLPARWLAGLPVPPSAGAGPASAGRDRPGTRGASGQRSAVGSWPGSTMGWWWSQKGAKFDSLVSPTAHPWTLWWAWQALAGLSPGNTQPLSRSSNAARSPG